MSILNNLGNRYRTQKKLIDEGKSRNPEYVLKNIEAVLDSARSFRNLNRPQAIRLSNKAMVDCEDALARYRQKDNIDMIFEINALKSEIQAFLTNFSVEEIDRALHKSDGDDYLDEARQKFILAKKMKNIKRIDSSVSALYAIARYDDALIFFKQESIPRKDIAIAEKQEVIDFLQFFTEDEIVEAKKIVLKDKDSGLSEF
ncbi:MAG: hypothetical protein GQ477_04175 [Nanohaloarchaea archaeon]|nr:hypothetical protein [Candidatus Nanohaloarchaea archaeon]